MKFICEKFNRVWLDKSSSKFSAINKLIKFKYNFKLFRIDRQVWQLECLAQLASFIALFASKSSEIFCGANIKCQKYFHRIPDSQFSSLGRRAIS